jgi:uncharacterized membrane protein
MDSNKRSIAKSISWHILHITMVAIIAYIITGSVQIAAILASAELLWESIAYYTHERVWARIKLFSKKE